MLTKKGFNALVVVCGNVHVKDEMDMSRQEN